MKRSFVFSLLFTAGICVLSFAAFAGLAALPDGVAEAASGRITQGALQIVGQDGQANSQCPLKHTAVKAEISGSLARTTVTQEFQNPRGEKIEAIYVFPLPANAAVDSMTMIVGGRTVKGKIKRREEARAIYEAARDAGQVASLLDQERPNIFTQSVANITPGATVKVTISYVETLKYEDGAYEFVFPMVVGPRYIPGQPAGKKGGGRAFDTSKVPDASRITPHIAPKGARAGHDISIEVNLDAGVPLDSLQSKSHEVAEQRINTHTAVVRLKNQSTIPNKDFILKFDVAGKKIADAVMTHRGQAGGFFTLMLQPPERVTVTDVSPKEIVFVLDTSGSMQGFPIEKAKEAMKLAIDGMNPQDTFNLITFAGDTHILFPQPVPATPENLHLAQAFLASRRGDGGTEMMEAIRAALTPSKSQDHVRVVCFMTDGEVGNDLEIIGEVRKHPNARVFAFGIGESVNRFLLDKMAEHGRGEVEYVSLSDDGSAAAKRFHERVRNPLLTDIRIDWNGLPIADVYPKRIPDLFSAKPLVLTGRYLQGTQGTIRLNGRAGGQIFTREIPVELPESQPEHDVLASLWARARIDELMSEDFEGIQSDDPREDVKEAITQLGLEFRLMTQFTSFVAVEEMTFTEGGQPKRVDVPVELPEGVSREGIFGQDPESRAGFSHPASPGMIAYSVVPAPPSPSLYQPAEAQLKSGAPIYRPPSSPPKPPPPPPMLSKTEDANIAKAPVVTPTPAPKKVRVSEGALQANVINKVHAAYPPIAKAARVSGSVQVQVVINEAGSVTDAKVISGHPLLRAAAVEAAKQWAFKPTLITGPPIRVQGILTFSFKLDNNRRPVAPPKSRPLSTNAAQHLLKLHPSVAAVVERLAAKTEKPADDEATFVQNGKADLQIWLTDKSAATLEQLKKLSVELVLNPQSSKLVIGRLPVEKLEALARLAMVRYVSPMTGLSRK